MDKIERLINLTAYLLDRGHPVTLEQLSTTVYADHEGGGEALRRMFGRDKDELRDMGIELEAVTAAGGEEVGYTISREKYYLPQIDLTPQERIALGMVSRLFLGSGTPFSGPAHSAMLKLAFDARAGHPELEVPSMRWVDVPRERGTLDTILDALVRRKVLSFSYRSLDAGEPLKREVEPYGLLNRRGSWYLVGRCRVREEVRCFKLDRITSKVGRNKKSPRSADFEVPTDFDLQKEARWEWLLPCEEEVKARVSFAPRLAFAFESGRANVVTSKRLKDGTLKVTYRVGDPEEFVDWVLEFGADARIISPPELVAMARERLQGVLRSLGGEDG
ncbi:MAG: WYL domain-containing protein [Actinobacteria bacterium]|nr:WYL domain-containing protein [Actinomycetota bacterium]